MTVENHIGNPKTLEAYYTTENWKHKAEIVIPRRSLSRISNDVGFVKGEDGTYRAIIGDIDETKFDEKWMKRLMNTYTEKGYMKIAKRKGLRFIGKTVKNGKMKLQFVSV